MCDKRAVEKEKINKSRRRQREIARAMAREIEMHDPDADSSDDPEPPVPEYPVVSPQRGRNDLEAHVEEDRSNSNGDVTEQEEEERRDDTTAESNADEQEDMSNESQSAEEQDLHRGSDDSESAEEEEEANEYDELRQWAIESNVAQKNLDKLLAIFRRRLLPNLPKSARTFLKTDSCPYIVDDTQHGQFVYFGIENWLQACIVEALHPESEIFLQFNIDGMPVFKSSTKQFWPILCRVHCPQSDIYQPFVVACYCGDAKPHDMTEYFHDFIEEINTLQRHGIIVNRKSYKVNIKCFICDGPARALLKNIKCHGGYSACERCTVHGERVKKNRGFCTVYPEVHKPMRTNESFRNLDDPNHHNGISPLLDIDPPIDIVKTFLLDKLHLLDGGAMKKELEHWMTGDLKVRLGRRGKLELDRRILSLRSQIPREFQRKPGTIFHLAKWKCTEFRLFLLYIGPIVLKNILPSALYNHFLLLHVAARILCSEDWALKYNRFAKVYLERYVLASRRLYGAHSLSLNTHNLIHVADDAKNMGCSLSCVSAYPFESSLGKLKKSIRTAYLPLPQVCRRIHERQLIELKRPAIPNQFQILKTKTNDDGIEQAIRVRYRKSILTDKVPDNVVLLKDLTIVQIDKMIVVSKNPDMIRIEGKKWKKSNPLYKYPSDSKHIRVWELRSEPSPVVGTCHLDSIIAKMMKLSLTFQTNGRKRVYALSLLHH